MRTVIAICVWSACYVGEPARARPAPAPAAPPRQAIRPEVTAAELGDPDVLDRITRRARVGSIHQAWVVRGGTPIRARQDFGPREIVPVLAFDASSVRIVETYDGARLALWIERSALARTVVKDVQLADAMHKLENDSGIWLSTGVDIDPTAAVQGWVQVKTRDDVRASGYVREDALGDIWTGPGPVELAHGDRRGLPAHTAVRAWPELQATVIADPQYDVGVELVGPQVGNMRQIEIRRPALRVLGWVPVDVLGSVTYGATMSSAAGSGHYVFGVAQRAFEAGTCLYDQPGGEVVGVVIDDKQRYAEWHAGQEWADVYVGTRWGVAVVFAHAVTDGRWESCRPG